MDAKPVLQLVSELSAELLEELGLDAHTDRVMETACGEHEVSGDLCSDTDLVGVRL